MATPAFVNGWSNILTTGAGGTISATVAPVAGHMLVAFCTWVTASGTDTCAMTDNSSTSANWVSNVDHVLDSTQGFQFASAYVLNANAPTTVTATATNAPGNMALIVMEYANVASSAALDGHNMNYQSAPGTAANAVTSNAASTLFDGDLIVGAVADYYGYGGNPTAGTSPNAFNSRTIVGTAGTTEVILGEDFIQTTHGSIAATFRTLSASDATIAAVMAFKAAPSAAGCIKGSLSLLGVGCGIWAAKKIEENGIITRRSLLLPRRRLTR